MANAQEVSIRIDDSFTQPVCDCCVGFLKFRKEGGFEVAYPAGTGTFVKLGKVYGILTAAHVLRPMGRTEVVGLVRFPSVQPPIQNYRLNLAYCDCSIDEWSGIEGAAPDIAFLKMPEVNGRNLEAIGAVFYNLGIRREFTRSDPRHRMAACHAVAGVVGEWTEEPGAETTGLHRKVTVGGLFGNAKNLREFKESDVDLTEVEIDYAAGLRRPESHGGVSGGGLWELNVELDQQLNTIAVNKRLLGVAFRESCDRRRITSNTHSSINAIAERIIAKWPDG